MLYVNQKCVIIFDFLRNKSLWTFQGYSLGFNDDHIFEISSRLEMEQFRKGKDPRDIEVSYIFCKQLFAPWENLDEDLVAIDLIYAQIFNGKS